MTAPVLKRQYITDARGTPIGIILPLEEFVLVEQILEERLRDLHLAEKLTQMEQAADDPAYLADLHATGMDFAHIDAEWWEPST